MTLHRYNGESIIDFRIRQTESAMAVAWQYRDWPDYSYLASQLEKLKEDKVNNDSRITENER